MDDSQPRNPIITRSIVYIYLRIWCCYLLLCLAGVYLNRLSCLSVFSSCFSIDGAVAVLPSFITVVCPSTGSNEVGQAFSMCFYPLSIPFLFFYCCGRSCIVVTTGGIVGILSSLCYIPWFLLLSLLIIYLFLSNSASEGV